MAKWLKTQEFITFDVKDKICRITMNRPEKRNALSPQLIKEIHDAMLEADDLVDVHVIVLQGAGNDFCAGYDLAAGYIEVSPEEAKKYRTRMGTFDDDVWTMTRKMHQMLIIPDVHKPVIAKVQGRALAGGSELALACDIVIAADDAEIGHPGVRGLGSPPINFWFYHTGPQWAKRLLLTGDSIRGEDAARIGLVLDSVPAAELDAEVSDLARRIAIVDPEITAANKRVVNIAMELAGARTLQKLATEIDARAHLSQGPLRKKFKGDVKEVGVREAISRRDDLFGGRKPLRIRNGEKK
ncbi:crotonase/enoyl-CoA hydratase family protein [Terricaulis silvestris]|uniref:Hydroxycinnamoyl-CoA hydratase-lyase n=1 Tax=Terricaulis silvestris TaxID=2686094 RepID=A0A6I6MIT2_9CAUL|nr:crotonase/enoyl-CoA hydratase family protein [Terricaulis silvestris]QGZ93691.1 Hydroxycinnamoyl-CoA hydratase-lyase [Terricaulis silvestris]